MLSGRTRQGALLRIEGCLRKGSASEGWLEVPAKQRCHKRRGNRYFHARLLLRRGTACRTECLGKGTLSVLVLGARVGTSVCQRVLVVPHHPQLGPHLQFQHHHVREQLQGFPNLQRRRVQMALAGIVLSVIDPEGRTTTIARWICKDNQWLALWRPTLLRRLTIGGTSTTPGYKIKQG